MSQEYFDKVLNILKKDLGDEVKALNSFGRLGRFFRGGEYSIDEKVEGTRAELSVSIGDRIIGRTEISEMTPFEEDGNLIDANNIISNTFGKKGGDWGYVNLDGVRTYMQKPNDVSRIAGVFVRTTQYNSGRNEFRHLPKIYSSL